MEATHLHLIAPRAPVAHAAGCGVASAAGRQLPSVKRPYAPTWSSAERTARFDHVGVLPQGEPKAP